VQDPAVTVTFPLLADSAKKIGAPAGTAMLAWTTTPWTLPSNLGLAVNNEVDYALVHERATGKHFILAEGRLAAYSKKPDPKNPTEDFETLKVLKGSELLGLQYEPLFPYFRL
jgi:isoleucyl-tRNA synthetase